ncbi:serine hydrolase [Lapidilactobacillus wuchangensis]|uniref:serine hydrolase n=1 Tax=Lapidilactobacillus wuchangensis TaxID=2486001 RepID=UPI000F77018A|nr:serine hydrolase [Lapidilactobacillus wuchangensis]
MKGQRTKLGAALVLLVSFIIGFSGVAGSYSQAATKQIEAPATTIAAKAGIAVAADSGQILAAKDIDTSLPIASMSKSLSLYLVLQAVKDGKLSWTQEIKPSAKIVTLSQNMNLSNIPFETDKSYTVKELYEASTIYSANAAIMALADAVSGSQTAFVDAMRAQLQKWGAKNYEIVNVSGLNNSYLGDDRYAGTAADAENKMSARDVAMVAQHLITDFPEFLETSSKTSIDFHGTTYPTWNLLLPGESAAQKDLPVDGIKTGTSDQAGDCFVGTVKKDGFRIITVVLHADGNADDQGKRFTATAALMNSIYQNWHQVSLFQAKKVSSHLAAVKVTNSKQKTVAVVPDKTVKLYLPKSTTAKQLDFKLAKGDASQAAPIAKYDQLGTIELPQIGAGFLQGANTVQVKVLAKSGVTALTWWEKVWQNITGLFNK